MNVLKGSVGQCVDGIARVIERRIPIHHLVNGVHIICPVDGMVPMLGRRLRTPSIPPAHTYCRLGTCRFQRHSSLDWHRQCKIHSRSCMNINVHAKPCVCLHCLCQSRLKRRWNLHVPSLQQVCAGGIAVACESSAYSFFSSYNCTIVLSFYWRYLISIMSKIPALVFYYTENNMICNHNYGHYYYYKQQRSKHEPSK